MTRTCTNITATRELANSTGNRSGTLAEVVDKGQVRTENVKQGNGGLWIGPLKQFLKGAADIQLWL